MNDIVRKAHSEKQLIVEEIKEKLQKAKSAVVIDYIGISVAQAEVFFLQNAFRHQSIKSRRKLTSLRLIFIKGFDDLDEFGASLRRFDHVPRRDLRCCNKLSEDQQNQDGN